ncbi:MAG: coxB [Bacillales bacterium]|jgi:cytochrome c oxidase subunit 2|nr:coxB [Bacillales bacterium]
MKKIKYFIFTVFLFLVGCGNEARSTLNPQGEVGKLQLQLMKISTWIMVFVIVVVLVLFIIILLKFIEKKDNKDFIPEQVEGNRKLEIIWTIVPILLILILAIPTVYYTFKLAVTDTEVVNKSKYLVNVNARLFWWEFEYVNEEFITSQELVIPVGKKVYFQLKGHDVKHSFWIPSLGGKQDTNVERTNRMYLIADKPGVYNGYCAEFCGASHALMQFTVKALPLDEYEQWVKNMKTKEKVSTNLNGEEIFNSKCSGCHSTDPLDPRPLKARIAPNLGNFADRPLVTGILKNSNQNIKEWLNDPEKYKPGNKMTNTYGELTEEETNKLIEYLNSLTR